MADVLHDVAHAHDALEVLEPALVGHARHVLAPRERSHDEAREADHLDAEDEVVPARAVLAREPGVERDDERLVVPEDEERGGSASSPTPRAPERLVVYVANTMPLTATNLATGEWRAMTDLVAR